ncbi:MAG: hypothetical protein FWE58_05605 [Methanobrevibacter sp.]|nr:hypothetical protein [Methanobrevibacter sp.]
MDNDISRVGEITLSIVGGVAGLIIGVIFFVTAFMDYGYLYGPNYEALLFGILSLAGGTIGIVSGAIFKYYTKIASILAIVASALSLAGGVIAFGIVGFILLLVAGVLGLVRK